MSDSQRQIRVGSVVQIDPSQTKNGKQWFGGCFLVVTEVKSWGVQGYVQAPGEEGQAYYRAEWKHIVYIGQAEWTAGALEESGADGHRGS